MAKCLVLGANGFIGSHLVKQLLSDGHTVRCFDRYKSTNNTASENPNVEIFAGDFLNRSSLKLATQDIDYVFHFVSTTTPFVSENDPLIDIETNILMSVELFKICTEPNSSIKKVIFASTGGAIYGDIDSTEPLNEETYPKPVSPYAIGKLTIENYLRYFNKKFNLDFMVARISNPYGPKQNTLSGQGVVSIFLERLLKEEPITIFGDGSMVRDYVYVEDVAKMLTRSFEHESKHKIYNIGAGKGLSVMELVDVIESVTSRKFTKEFKDTPQTYIDHVVLDDSRYKKEFGNAELTAIEEGVSKTWQLLQKKK